MTDSQSSYKEDRENDFWCAEKSKSPYQQSQSIVHSQNHPKNQQAPETGFKIQLTLDSFRDNFNQARQFRGIGNIFQNKSKKVTQKIQIREEDNNSSQISQSSSMDAQGKQLFSRPRKILKGIKQKARNPKKLWQQSIQKLYKSLQVPGKKYTTLQREQLRSNIKKIQENDGFNNFTNFHQIFQDFQGSDMVRQIQVSNKSIKQLEDKLIDYAIGRDKQRYSNAKFDEIPLQIKHQKMPKETLAVEKHLNQQPLQKHNIKNYLLEKPYLDTGLILNLASKGQIQAGQRQVDSLQGCKQEEENGFQISPIEQQSTKNNNKDFKKSSQSYKHYLKELQGQTNLHKLQYIKESLSFYLFEGLIDKQLYERIIKQPVDLEKQQIQKMLRKTQKQFAKQDLQLPQDLPCSVFIKKEEGAIDVQDEQQMMGVNNKSQKVGIKPKKKRSRIQKNKRLSFFLRIILKKHSANKRIQVSNLARYVRENYYDQLFVLDRNNRQKQTQKSIRIATNSLKRRIYDCINIFEPIGFIQKDQNCQISVVKQFQKQEIMKDLREELRLKMKHCIKDKKQKIQILYEKIKLIKHAQILYETIIPRNQTKQQIGEQDKYYFPLLTIYYEDNIQYCSGEGVAKITGIGHFTNQYFHKNIIALRMGLNNFIPQFPFKFRQSFIKSQHRRQLNLLLSEHRMAQHRMESESSQQSYSQMAQRQSDPKQCFDRRQDKKFETSLNKYAPIDEQMDPQFNPDIDRYFISKPQALLNNQEVQREKIQNKMQTHKKDQIDAIFSPKRSENHQIFEYSEQNSEQRLQLNLSQKQARDDKIDNKKQDQECVRISQNSSAIIRKEPQLTQKRKSRLRRQIKKRVQRYFGSKK